MKCGLAKRLILRAVLGLETGDKGWIEIRSEGRGESENVLQLSVCFFALGFWTGFVGWWRFVRLSMVG